MHNTSPLNPNLQEHIQTASTELVAVLLDWWMFGHLLNGWQIFATGLILLAVAGMNLNWTFSRKTKRPESPSRC